MKADLVEVQIGQLTFITFYKYGTHHKIKWYWHCKAANGKLVCTSGESFDSKSNAVRAMKTFIAHVTGAEAKGVE